jgi:arylsulfatase A-like enzyme
VGALEILGLSLWCGLAGGLLEVAARVSCRAIDPTNRLYVMTRHFVWLTPVANAIVFVSLGLILAGVTELLRGRGRWLATRVIGALTIVPMLMVIIPQVFPEAWFILALGFASQLVPWLEHRPSQTRRALAYTLPGLIGLIAILAGVVFGEQWLKTRRAAHRPMLPAGTPNVLLIVLDTVRADRLSLYGYRRPTTPALERLAERGIRFDAARAPAPWTVPSHASFFSGRWPHELGVKWTTPIQTPHPMIAEYLGLSGYATVGIAANIFCSYDTGLDRGFTHFEDFAPDRLGFMRTAILFEEFMRSVYMWDYHDATGVAHFLRGIADVWFNTSERRDAASISRGFLDWHGRRSAHERPFFAYLNYFDAHAPYKLPDKVQPRFARKVQTQDEIRAIYDNWSALDRILLPKNILSLASDCYDDCIRYLDEQVGLLLDELQNRGDLDRTLVVITSDHGEGMGEHDLFDHGESLYDTEILVPLLILLPSAERHRAIVREVVSLRDLPATIVDIAGLSTGSPFPGRSLASLWREPGAQSAVVSPDAVVSELLEPSPGSTNRGRSPAYRGPLISFAEGNFVYIRNEGNGSEELFDEHDDPRQLTNLARSEAMKPVLERFRQAYARIKPGASALAK